MKKKLEKRVSETTTSREQREDTEPAFQFPYSLLTLDDIL